MLDRETIKSKFEKFSETECKNNSNLYYTLSKQVANDDDLVEICLATKEGQPIPNIFFGAVHYLLLKNSKSPLARFYPSIFQKEVEEIPFDVFKRFCLANENSIQELISTKIVQTNVISRCAYLIPIFSQLIEQENRPTTILDIGTSAGLTLNFDKYAYRFNNEKVYGDSTVVINCEIVGKNFPTIVPVKHPLTKIGLDQHIIDVKQEDEITWLKALLWPDQLERFKAMEEALKINSSINNTLIEASTIASFRKQLEGIDNSENLLIYTTHVIYQFPVDFMNEFFNMLEAVGKTKDFYFLSVGGKNSHFQSYESNDVAVELTQFKKGNKRHYFIAETNGHGNWVRWKNFNIDK